MKNAPWVRLASRISPKISENPDESRNSRPPSDRLLRPWMIQNCIGGRSCSKSCEMVGPQLRLQVLGRRIVARIDRIFQEGGLVVGPELADIRIGLDDGIDQPSVASCYFSDIDVADDISEFVEFDDPAYRFHVI